MTTQYRPLEEGEALEIGDEYESEGQWKELTESDYGEWVTACSHYWPGKGMSEFRRPLNKDPVLVTKTKAILDKAVSSTFDLKQYYN